MAGEKAVHDPEFNTTVKWDVELLDGFSWTEIPNKGNGGPGFFGLFNPGLWGFIRKGFVLDQLLRVPALSNGFLVWHRHIYGRS